MSYDLKQLKSSLKPFLDCKLPCLLRGSHGIGKSEIVYQVAKKKGLEVEELRASQMTEGDLLGLPDTGKDYTEFKPPKWFYDACQKPVVLFFDEVDRATSEVAQGIFQVTDSRAIHGRKLHEDTIVMGAVNASDSYEVREMDPAELDRWEVFDVEPSIEDWLEWAKDKVSNFIVEFINNNRDHLEASGTVEPNKVYPSRRSWVRLDKVIKQAGYDDNPKENADSIYMLSEAVVGFEAATAFSEFIRTWENQVSAEEIVNDGKFDRVKNFNVTDFSKLVRSIENSGILDETLTDNQAYNIAKLMQTMPSECMMQLWSILAKDVENTAKVHKQEVNGKSMQEHLAETIGESDG